MERAVMLVKPCTPRGQMAASVPPATITSASSYLMALKASPMEWDPEAHAVTMAPFLPFIPYMMEILAEAILAIMTGI